MAKKKPQLATSKTTEIEKLQFHKNEVYSLCERVLPTTTLAANWSIDYWRCAVESQSFCDRNLPIATCFFYQSQELRCDDLQDARGYCLNSVDVMELKGSLREGRGRESPLIGARFPLSCDKFCEREHTDEQFTEPRKQARAMMAR
jgi:hypothetical protein